MVDGLRRSSHADSECGKEKREEVDGVVRFAESGVAGHGSTGCTTRFYSLLGWERSWMGEKTDDLSLERSRMGEKTGDLRLVGAKQERADAGAQRVRVVEVAVVEEGNLKDDEDENKVEDEVKNKEDETEEYVKFHKYHDTVTKGI